MYFDKFDICSAYNMYAVLWNGSRYTNAIHCRLSKLGYRCSRSEEHVNGLTENAQEILLALVAREEGAAAANDLREELGL